jgi:hypothetical protein
MKGRVCKNCGSCSVKTSARLAIELRSWKERWMHHSNSQLSPGDRYYRLRFFLGILEGQGAHRVKIALYKNMKVNRHNRIKEQRKKGRREGDVEAGGITIKKRRRGVYIWNGLALAAVITI